ncbi:MAG TPA: hypothetical protein VFT64_08920 [Rickettsiales bacterium]|nr:hypothetical protein [Rickettsiales bacterium]
MQDSDSDGTRQPIQFGWVPPDSSYPSAPQPASGEGTQSAMQSAASISPTENSGRKHGVGLRVGLAVTAGLLTATTGFASLFGGVFSGNSSSGNGAPPRGTSTSSVRGGGNATPDPGATADPLTPTVGTPDSPYPDIISRGSGTVEAEVGDYRKTFPDNAAGIRGAIEDIMAKKGIVPGGYKSFTVDLHGNPGATSAAVSTISSLPKDTLSNLSEGVILEGMDVSSGGKVPVADIKEMLKTAAAHNKGTQFNAIVTTDQGACVIPVAPDNTPVAPQTDAGRVCKG